MLSIQIIFIELDSEGETCSICKELIRGKKWVMMLDFGDPTTSVPLEKDLCTICKINMENSNDVKN